MAELIKDSAALIAACVLLAVWFFCGFGLGDDPAYHSLAVRIAESGYPEVRATDVFAGRPILLLALVAGYAVFGTAEWVFVLPTMVAAVLCVLATYMAGRHFGGRAAGLIAALLLLTSPLHLAQATTLTNDIVGAAFLGSGAVCVLYAAGARRCSMVFASVGGVLTGLAGGVKNSFLLLDITLVLLVVAWSFSARRLRIGGSFAAGAAIAFLVLMLFFGITAGDPLAALKAELAFNRIHILPGMRSTPLAEILMMYPRLAGGLLKAGPAGFQWAPGGVLFLLFLAAWLGAFRTHHRAALAVGLLALTWSLVLQFWPMSVSPYVPIHRLPRFAYPVMLPAAVCTGLVFARLLRRRATRVFVWAVLAVVVPYHVEQAWRAVHVHRDSMTDVRFAADIVLATARPVLLDEELMMYVRYRTHQRTVPPLLQLSPTADAPPGALIVAGGSRRPELEPQYTSRLLPPRTPDSWHPLLRLPGAVAPWRPHPGTIYLAAAEANRRPQLKGACPEPDEWVLKDLLDVGNPESEAAHGFVISGQTWKGERWFRSSDGNVWDDGRAFVGAQSFVVGVEPLKDICLVKRIDGLVSPQVSRWSVGSFVSREIVSAPPRTAEWGHVVVLVSGTAIRESKVTVREAFVSSPGDVNAFRIEIYQRAAASAVR